MSTTSQSIVLYGPAGCGKTTNAERIAQAFGLSTIVEWEAILSRPAKQRVLQATGVLVITNDPDAVDAEFTRVSYDHAMKAVALFELKPNGWMQ